MDKEVISYKFNGITVTTQWDIGCDCGVVEIPHLGLKVNGAWDWGPHNPRKPGVLGILVGAMQALGAHFNEFVMEGEPEMYAMGVQAINNVLSRQILGEVQLKDKPNTAVLTTMIIHEGREYEITRTAEFEVLRGFSGTTDYVGTRICWKSHNAKEELGITTTLRNADIVPYFQKRTTKELALDYISRYGVAQ